MSASPVAASSSSSASSSSRHADRKLSYRERHSSSTLSRISGEEMLFIKPESVSKISSKKFANLRPEALSAMTLEQVRALRSTQRGKLSLPQFLCIARHLKLGEFYERMDGIRNYNHYATAFHALTEKQRQSIYGDLETQYDETDKLPARVLDTRYTAVAMYLLATEISDAEREDFFEAVLDSYDGVPAREAGRLVTLVTQMARQSLLPTDAIVATLRHVKDEKLAWEIYSKLPVACKTAVYANLDQPLQQALKAYERRH